VRLLVSKTVGQFDPSLFLPWHNNQIKLQVKKGQSKIYEVDLDTFLLCARCAQEFSLRVRREVGSHMDFQDLPQQPH